MFTQRAGLLGFVAFCFYLIAVVNELPGFYYLLSWMSLGLLAASLGIAFLSLNGLKSQWRLGQTRGYANWEVDTFSEESDAEVPTLFLSLHNRGSLNKTGLLLEVQFRVIANPSDAPTPKSGKGKKGNDALTTHRYLLEALPSGSTIEVSLPLYNLPRGRHEIVQILLIGADVLGLFRTRRRLISTTDAKQEFVVGPPLSVLPSTIHAAGRGRFSSGKNRIQRFGMGDEVRGTRPYVHGDDLRHVHWKSTARVGDLVVREWEHTGHSTVLVVWDGPAGTTWGNGRFNTTEIGLSLVASLCVTLMRSGVPCALACLGEESLYMEPDFRGGSQNLSEEQFLALASARALRNGAAMAALEGASRGHSREFDVVFWVTASLSPAVLDSIRRHDGHVQVRVALVDGARILEWTADARSAKNAIESTDNITGTKRGAGVSGISVSVGAYDSQEKALKEAGVFVTRVAPRAADEVSASLRSAIESLVELV